MLFDHRRVGPHHPRPGLVQTHEEVGVFPAAERKWRLERAWLAEQKLGSHERIASASDRQPLPGTIPWSLKISPSLDPRRRKLLEAGQHRSGHDVGIMAH